MATSTRPDFEEKDGGKENIKPDKFSAEPSWIFSFAVAFVQATLWWLQYIGLFFRHALGSSRVPQAARMSPKPQFWRVTGIENCDRLHAQEWLQKASPGGHSLAGVSTQRLCATLTTYEKPKPALDGWSVESAFLGITPLSGPADAAVDVVVITGLGGHAMGSFRSTDGTFVWLRDALPKTLPKARILTYGYDTALLRNKSKESIRDLAKVFLDALAGFRYGTKTQQRPLCFIGHSLGGVVLKEALAIADINQNADSHEVVLSTYGLILLGVPNLGLRHPQLMTMVEGNPNQQFVRDLVVDEDEAPSPYLNELTAKFSRVCSRVTPPFHIVSYYETERSPTVKLHKESRFELSGELMMMVTERSAERIGHTIRDDGHLPMAHTNHRGLVRFDHADDPRYISLQDKIQRQTERAPEVVRRRYAHIQGLSTEQQRLWIDLNRPPFSDFRESDKLVRPEEGTLLWLLEPETVTDVAINAVPATMKEPFNLVKDQAAKPLTGEDFADWRDSAASCCLLVTAPAGSGKSVLSNFVTMHLENHAVTGRTEKIIYYFCNIRVPISERSAETVVRALIVQLCQDQGNLIALLSPRFEENSETFRKAPLGELWGILSLMIQKHPFSHVYCVIDGLDVYGECMVELVQKLLSLFRSSDSGAPRLMKLLCTSRPEPGILKTWEGFLERQLRPNENDLRTYIDNRTAGLRNFSESMREAARSALMKDFEDSQDSKNSGPTFLWTSVAIRKLEQMRYPTVADVKAEVENSSRDLDDLFENLIITASERARVNAVILAWIIYAQQPLSLDELQEATAIDPSRDYVNYDQLDDTRPMLSWSSVRQELGVLIDNIEGKLFVIHQSVHDFVKKAKLLDRWISPEPRLFLGDCCMQYLLLCTVRDQTSMGSLSKADTRGKGYPLQRISEHWYQYIETRTEGYERLPTIRAIASRPACLSPRSHLKYWMNDTIYDLTDLSVFICINDLGWMAELVFEGALAAPDDILRDSVLAFAAGHCKRLFQILLSRWHPRGRNIMQTMVESAAENFSSGKEVMQLLLQNKTYGVHITQEVLAAAAGNHGSGKEVMQLLLDERPNEVHITAEVIAATARNANCGGDVMQLLLDRRPDEMYITQTVLAAAAGNYKSGGELMQLLLDSRPDEVHITPEVVVAAAGNTHSGRMVMQLLLDSRPDEVHITPEVVVAAAGNTHSGRMVMQLLLDSRPDEVHITPEVVVAAAGNFDSGRMMMQLLLESRPEEVHITPEVVVAAAGNTYSGRMVMQLLLDSRPEEVHITPEVVVAAAGNFDSGRMVMQLLLDSRPDEVHITTEVIVAAAGNTYSGRMVMQLLLDSRPDEVHITTEVVVAAAGNTYSGRMVMQLLLDSRPEEVHITPDVVVAAAGNTGDGREVVQLLLDRRKDAVLVTPKAILAAAKNTYSGRDVLILFLRRQELDLSFIDEHGRTPLLWAVLRGNRAMLDLLLKLDSHHHDLSQVSMCDKLGCSIIHLAAIGNCLDLIEKTSNFDRTIHAIDNQGWTALHWTAYFGHRRAASILVDHGASLDCRNKQGWTPYQLALFSRSQYVAEVVLSGSNSSKDAIEELSEDMEGSCNSCYRGLIGYQYHCRTCITPGYDLCFRCFHDVDQFHPKHDFSDLFRYSEHKKIWL